MYPTDTVKFGIVGAVALAILAIIAAVIAMLFGVDISRLFF
jgi:hypothetical protein